LTAGKATGKFYSNQLHAYLNTLVELLSNNIKRVRAIVTH